MSVAFVALMGVGAVGGSAAHAQSSDQSGGAQSVDALRAEADAIANRYFAALARAQQLDEEISEAEQTVAGLEADADAARAAARARAVAAYRQSSSRMTAIVDSDSAMDATRRARLVDELNQRDHESYTRLRNTSTDLRAQRKELDARRAAQVDAVTDLRQQAADADAKLAVAQRSAAELSAQQAAAAAAAQRSTTTSPGGTTSGGSSTSNAASTSAPSSSAPTKPVAPPGYSGTPGVHPQHDDPVLSCIRARESGGNYAIVSRDGYLGAYQFAQSTWNISASRAGMSGLVGVPANQASQYDQDAVAWALLQAQGLGPWGGHCP